MYGQLNIGMLTVLLILFCCARLLSSYRSPHERSLASSYSTDVFQDNDLFKEQHPVVARRLNPIPEKNVIAALRGLLRRTRKLRDANVSSEIFRVPATSKPKITGWKYRIEDNELIGKMMHKKKKKK